MATDLWDHRLQALILKMKRNWDISWEHGPLQGHRWKWWKCQVFFRWFPDDSEILMFLLSILFGYRVAFLVFSCDKTLRKLLVEKLPNMNLGNDQLPNIEQKWINKLGVPHRCSRFLSLSFFFSAVTYKVFTDWPRTAIKDLLENLWNKTLLLVNFWMFSWEYHNSILMVKKVLYFRQGNQVRD